MIKSKARFHKSRFVRSISNWFQGRLLQTKLDKKLHLDLWGKFTHQAQPRYSRGSISFDQSCWCSFTFFSSRGGKPPARKWSFGLHKFQEKTLHFSNMAALNRDFSPMFGYQKVSRSSCCLSKNRENHVYGNLAGEMIFNTASLDFGASDLS